MLDKNANSMLPSDIQDFQDWGSDISQRLMILVDNHELKAANDLLKQSFSEFKKEYYKLSSKYHPDKVDDVQEKELCTEHFKSLSNIYTQFKAEWEEIASIIADEDLLKILERGFQEIAAEQAMRRQEQKEIEIAQENADQALQVIELGNKKLTEISQEIAKKSEEMSDQALIIQKEQEETAEITQIISEKQSKISEGQSNGAVDIKKKMEENEKISEQTRVISEQQKYIHQTSQVLDGEAQKVEEAQTKLFKSLKLISNDMIQINQELKIASAEGKIEDAMLRKIALDQQTTVETLQSIKLLELSEKERAKLEENSASAFVQNEFKPEIPDSSLLANHIENRIGALASQLSTLFKQAEENTVNTLGLISDLLKSKARVRDLKQRFDKIKTKLANAANESSEDLLVNMAEADNLLNEADDLVHSENFNESSKSQLDSIWARLDELLARFINSLPSFSGNFWHQSPKHEKNNGQQLDNTEGFVP